MGLKLLKVEIGNLLFILHIFSPEVGVSNQSPPSSTNMNLTSIHAFLSDPSTQRMRRDEEYIGKRVRRIEVAGR